MNKSDEADFENLVRRLSPADRAELDRIRETNTSGEPDTPLFLELAELYQRLVANRMGGSLQRRLTPDKAHTFLEYFPILLDHSAEATGTELSTMQRSLIYSVMDFAFCMGHDYVVEHGPLMGPIKEGGD